MAQTGDQALRHRQRMRLANLDCSSLASQWRSRLSWTPSESPKGELVFVHFSFVSLGYAIKWLNCGR